MKDHDLLWTANQDLQITSLTARLRNLLFPVGVPFRLHVSELWQEDDPLGILLLAHQWVLEGDRIAFDTERGGMRLRISLEPLYNLSGEITGVGGLAIPGAGGGESEWKLETLEEVERICGFGTWRTSLETGQTLWSAGFHDILGLDDLRKLGNLRDFDHPEDTDAVADAIRDGEITGTGYRCDHRIVRTDGTIRHVQEQAYTLYDDSVACAQVGSVLDITERKATEARLAHLAHYDPVSKLPNRTLLEQRLHASLSRAQMNGTRCAVLFLDIDDFKRINDTYGHAAGDEVLEAVGARLCHHVRARDTVARMSGDEFVIVLDELASPEDTAFTARKILKSFEAPLRIGTSVDCRVGASIGVAIYPECAASAKGLIDIADREMYVVKRNGGRGIKIACETSSAAPSLLRTAANG
jgi:diguanylate cyclase (GGDEF)-like protein/PAS domain S-box-containing protein